MPSFRGYNPPKQIKGENVPEVPDPDGLYSGIALGLARDGDGFCDIQNMPPDSRDVGVLPDKNYDED
jgi:hypothetical protein